jgi:hypothetical protein
LQLFYFDGHDKILKTKDRTRMTRIGWINGIINVNSFHFNSGQIPLSL